jgi:DNA topoisomerase VI subunit B
MFEHFDPLQKALKAKADEGAVRDREKRSIHSILHSYVGWYDPLSELIQNALDAVDRKRVRGEAGYEPTCRVWIDLQSNRITVSDNGTGLDQTAFEEFLAPNVSFYKGQHTRGSKGVGATYLAYGFNFIRVDTKTGKFSARGTMEGARTWLHDVNASENPRVYPTEAEPIDDEFGAFETGTSISVGFNKTQRLGVAKLELC